MINLNDKDRKELSRKYGRVVKTVNFYKGGVCADVFMERDTLTFSARLNDKQYSSKDGKLVEVWLEKEIQSALSLVWQPVITVLDLGDDRRARNFNYSGRMLELHCINLDIHRFFAATLPDGDVRAVGWEVPEDRRLLTHDVPFAWVHNIDKAEIVKNGAICLPLHDGDTHILPYSEELWLGFQELLKGIDRLQGRIKDLIMTDVGLKKLSATGAKFSLLLGDSKS